ncbi:MAG: tetratricopeptide repeat protein [Puniceicoccales bacterium]
MVRRCIVSVVGGVALLVALGCGGSDVEKDPFEEGLRSLSIFDFEVAYKNLSIAVEQMDPSDPQWIEAAYALGIAAWHQSPSRAEYIRQATELFEQIAETTDQKELKYRCYLNLARILEVPDYVGDAKDIEGARSYYEETLEAMPGTDVGSQANFRLAQTYLEQMNDESFQEAVMIVTDYLNEYPDAPLANVGWQFVADIQKFYLNNREAALEAMMKAYDLGFAVQSKEDVYIWQIADLAMGLDQNAEAVEFLTTLVKHYPRSKYRWVAREELKRLAEENPEMNIEIPELTAYGEV